MKTKPTTKQRQADKMVSVWDRIGLPFSARRRTQYLFVDQQLAWPGSCTGKKNNPFDGRHVGENPEKRERRILLLASGDVGVFVEERVCVSEIRGGRGGIKRRKVGWRRGREEERGGWRGVEERGG